MEMHHQRRIGNDKNIIEYQHQSAIKCEEEGMMESHCAAHLSSISVHTGKLLLVFWILLVSHLVNAHRPWGPDAAVHLAAVSSEAGRRNTQGGFGTVYSPE